MDVNEAKPRSCRIGGRPPGGPNGEPRDKVITIRVSASEREGLFANLRALGLSGTNGGARDFLLEQAARKPGKEAMEAP